MILKVDGQEQILVQVTDSVTGESRGLYLVPNTINLDDFEREFKRSKDQYEFDEFNDLGVQRIFAYDSILDLEF